MGVSPQATDSKEQAQEKKAESEEKQQKQEEADSSLDISTLAAAGQQQQQQQLVPSAIHSVSNNIAALQAAALHGLVPHQPLVSVTHNLIPTHLQASALAPSLHGTPGYPPSLVTPNLIGSAAAAIHPQPQLSHPHHPLPVVSVPNAVHGITTIPDDISFLLSPQPVLLTVQDRPMTPPVYNGVNPNYPGLQVLHTSPPIFAVENFLTPFECEFLIHAAHDSFGPAPVVGKGAGEISPSRTSSTCYLAREDLPDLIRKVCLLTGKPPEHCELPQVGRYLPTQQYLQHFDAFDLATEDGRRFASNGGQRTITVLIYLNNVELGGATRFSSLNLDVQPRQGMALVFFPATIDGFLDKNALHAALPAVDTKYVSQVWIRQGNYSGQPSKRLPQTLGIPFHHQQQHQQQPPLATTSHHHTHNDVMAAASMTTNNNLGLVSTNSTSTAHRPF